MIYIILIIGFLIRALPRIFLPNIHTSDTYFHMYCANMIRENSLKIPLKLNRVVLAHDYTYPFGYHYYLAILPIKIRVWAERFSGAIFDTLSAVVLYIYLSFLVNNNYIQIIELPEIVTLLFVISPALLRIGSGPRAYNGSPRVMAQALYLLHITSAHYAILTNNLFAILISTLAGGILIITAKFGNQVLILFGIIISIFYPGYILFIAGSLIVALILSKGHAISIIKGQIRHSMFYVLYLQKSYLWPNLKSIRQYSNIALSVIWNAVKHCKFRILIQWFYTEQYYLHIIISVYPFILLYPLYIYEAPKGNLPVLIYAWAGAGILWFLLTKIKWIMFLGEGERYLEYALLPLLLLFSIYCFQNNIILLYALFIYSVISAIYYLLSYIKQYDSFQKDHKDTEKLFNSINNMPIGVIWPIGSFHYQALYRTKNPVLTHGCNFDENLLDPQDFYLLYGNYPYPSEKFEVIINKYNVKYILTDKLHLNHYIDNILNGSSEFMNRISLLFESESLVCYEIVE